MLQERVVLVVQQERCRQEVVEMETYHVTLVLDDNELDRFQGYVLAMAAGAGTDEDYELLQRVIAMLDNARLARRDQAEA